MDREIQIMVLVVAALEFTYFNFFGFAITFSPLKVTVHKAFGSEMQVKAGTFF